MLTPYIVDLNGLDLEKKSTVLDIMNDHGYTGYMLKPSDNTACFLLDRHLSIEDVARLLSLDAPRITDATGWDLEVWKRR